MVARVPPDLAACSAPVLYAWLPARLLTANPWATGTSLSHLLVQSVPQTGTL